MSAIALFSDLYNFYLYAGWADIRKSFDGLSGIVVHNCSLLNWRCHVSQSHCDSIPILFALSIYRRIKYLMISTNIVNEPLILSLHFVKFT